MQYDNAKFFLFLKSLLCLEIVTKDSHRLPKYRNKKGLVERSLLLEST